MIGQFLQMKINFLPTNTTSRLQPLDAGIIQNFKVKYWKRLVKNMLASIHEDASATKVFKGADVIVAIWWLQEAWKEVTNITIKNCFEKCNIKADNELIEVKEYDDLDFEALQNMQLSMKMSQRLSQWSMNLKFMATTGQKRKH